MISIEAPGAVRTMMISFRRGDYIIEELQKLLKKEGVDAALITSGIGSFDICKLHTITRQTFPQRIAISTLRGPSKWEPCMGQSPAGNPTSMSSCTTRPMTSSMLGILNRARAAATVLSWA